MTRPPSPPAQPLPGPFRFGPNGLEHGGRPVEEIAERYGTPVYLTSERRLRENARRVRRTFEASWPGYRLLYAVKANANPALVRVLREEGCGADCSSPAEIEIARRAGVPSAETLYTAAFPSDAELSYAARAGVAVNLDDPDLLPRLLRFGPPPLLSFRLDPNTTASGPEGLRFSGPGSKFGVDLPRALKGYRAARRAGLRDFGVHTMPGSNVLDPTHFERVGRYLGRAARRIAAETRGPLAFADAGGGFGVPYRPGESPLDLDRVANGLTGALRRVAQDLVPR